MTSNHDTCNDVTPMSINSGIFMNGPPEQRVVYEQRYVYRERHVYEHRYIYEQRFRTNSKW